MSLQRQHIELKTEWSKFIKLFLQTAAVVHWGEGTGVWVCGEGGEGGGGGWWGGGCLQTSGGVHVAQWRWGWGGVSSLEQILQAVLTDRSSGMCVCVGRSCKQEQQSLRCVWVLGEE